MKNHNSRYVQIGEWVFELKTVRALKVDQYGKPYTAIANCNINGDQMYIDGLLNKDDENITREDFETFKAFAEHLELDGFSYHRFQNGQSITRQVNLSSDAVESETEAKSDTDKVPMRLVK
ncbi:hypothetical protein [Thalassotalea fusca]